jgi:hypothetical protein
MTNSRAASLWVWLGVVMAVVMPFTAIATALSAQVVTNDAAPILMLIILGVISLSAHLLILFGGKLAHASKTYLLFTMKYRALKTELARCRVVLRRRVQKFQMLFIPYVHHWRKHTEIYSYVEAGPFDNDVAGLLRRQFPYLNKTSSDDDPHRG